MVPSPAGSDYSAGAGVAAGSASQDRAELAGCGPSPGLGLDRSTYGVAQVGQGLAGGQGESGGWTRVPSFALPVTVP